MVISASTQRAAAPDPRGPVHRGRRCSCGIALAPALPVVISAQLLHRDRREPHDTPVRDRRLPARHKTIQRCGPDSGTRQVVAVGSLDKLAVDDGRSRRADHDGMQF